MVLILTHYIDTGELADELATQLSHTALLDLIKGIEKHQQDLDFLHDIMVWSRDEYEKEMEIE